MKTDIKGYEMMHNDIMCSLIMHKISNENEKYSISFFHMILSHMPHETSE